MVEDILRVFSYLTDEKGYSVEVKQITYIFSNIIFSNKNIRVIFEYELMNNQFDFEINVKSENAKYSICEYIGRRKLFYENKENFNIIHKSVYEYTNNYWNERTFQQEKEKIYNQRYLINKQQKIFIQLLSLYKGLLDIALDNIEKGINL